MKISVLGCGGWIPTPLRETSCFLIETQQSLILLDAGTGISRLNEYSELLSKYKEIHIILSHYHLDHIIGLIYISNWAKEKVVNVYGPGEKLIGRSCKEVLTTMLTPPYFVGTEKIGEKVNFIDYDINGIYINDTKFSISEQIHSGKSFGITVGSFVHYATDTAITETTFIQAKNAKMLLHDCWSIENQNSLDHTCLKDIVSMQRKYQIEQVGLIHINPNWTSKDLLNLKDSLLNQDRIILFEDKMLFSL